MEIFKENLSSSPRFKETTFHLSTSTLQDIQVTITSTKYEQLAEPNMEMVEKNLIEKYSNSSAYK